MGMKEQVYNKLEEMKIPFSVINHKAIFSEKETDLSSFDKNIVIGKNLFLRNDKKRRYYLVCLPLLKRANLEKLAELLGEKRLSFANENELKAHLAISPGSVSYLNVITAEEEKANYMDVTYVIDSSLFDACKIGFHPSYNTATVVTDPDAIISVLNKYELKYIILDL